MYNYSFSFERQMKILHDVLYKAGEQFSNTISQRKQVRKTQGPLLLPGNELQEK